MATQQTTPRQQVLPSGAYMITFDNGTGTRSTVGTTEATMPGATGDTSYTAPADQDVTLHLSMTQMTDRTAGTTQCWIAIDDVKTGQSTYMAESTLWKIQTTHTLVDVDAGDTVDIGCRWKQSTGTGTVTNKTNDSDQFPNHIAYTVHPRAV